LITLANSPNPYDGADDQLIGVIKNDPNFNIGGINLTRPSDLFGFDGDGICTHGPLNPFGNTVATPSGFWGTARRTSATPLTNGEPHVVANEGPGLPGRLRLAQPLARCGSRRAALLRGSRG